jgi:nanoRNase/pAp phosphatase (c-di-AMP/oligoRNAs hydrolase)
VSARRQDLKVKMNELLETALGKGSGGGHVPAAAGILPRKNLKVFKSNIIRLLKSPKFKSD